MFSLLSSPGYRADIEISSLNTFRLIAILAALALHLLALIWIVSRPAGSFALPAEPNPSPVLAVSLISTRPTAEALPPLADEAPAELEPSDETQSTDFPAPANHVDTVQPGLIPDYYPAKALSQMPVALTDFDAMQAEVSSDFYGKLSVRLWLNESGQVDRISALTSDMPKEMESIALASFAKMLFKAGEINNVPVKTWVDIVIDYGDRQELEVELPIEVKKPALNPVGH